MAGDGTSFEIDLSGVKGAAAVTAAADGVERLSSSLQAAVTSATAAADAVTAGEAAYKAAEASANAAAKAVEKIGLQADAQRGKLAKALEAGDTGGVARAESALAKLVTRQGEATAKAAAATTAMNAEATALDKMKASAAGAADSQASVAKALDVAKTKATAATKALAATSKPINAGEAAGALGKLGGPLGAVGQKAFDAADAFKKMGSSLGGAGPYVAVAVGIAAIVAGVLAVSAAAAVGIAGITLWAVKLADADGAIKKMSDRLGKNINKMFSGLKIKPLLAELDKVADLFEEGSASANAAKAVFESLFQPIVDGVVGVLPKLIAGFIQVEIQIMKGMIQLKKIWQEWGDIITTVAKVVGIVVLAAVVGLTVVIGILAAGVAAMAVGFTVAIAVVVALAAGLGWVISKVVEVGAAIMGGMKAALDWLGTLSLADIGTALIDGLIAGITGAGAGVLKAITGIAGGAVDAAKGLLGIASPSKVFAEIGGQTADGMAVGLDDGMASVQGSMESLVSPPDAPAAAAASPAAASPAAGGGGTFNITVNGGSEAIAAAIRAMLVDLGAQAGAAVPT